MGLLDDAIRQHLDLKRRHGADPAEIEEAEREALGPVRRAPAEPGDAELHDDQSDEPNVAYDHEDDLAWDEPLDEPRDGRVAEEEDFEFEELGEPAAGSGPAHAESWDDEDAPEQREPESDEPPPPPKASSRPLESSEPADEETVEYEIESEHERGDMLQETPEFLQDTPDHDRLWFEQRPPRDFDFDG